MSTSVTITWASSCSLAAARHQRVLRRGDSARSSHRGRVVPLLEALLDRPPSRAPPATTVFPSALRLLGYPYLDAVLVLNRVATRSSSDLLAGRLASPSSATQHLLAPNSTTCRVLHTTGAAASALGGARSTLSGGSSRPLAAPGACGELAAAPVLGRRVSRRQRKRALECATWKLTTVDVFSSASGCSEVASVTTPLRTPCRMVHLEKYSANNRAAFLAWMRGDPSSMAFIGKSCPAAAANPEALFRA